MARFPSPVASPASILASILLSSFPISTFAEADAGAECSCFRTNGSSQGYFSHYQFQDYRNIVGASDPPALIIDSTEAANSPATSEFFLDEAWTNQWAIQSWNNSESLATSDASVLMVNSPNNVYIEKSGDSSPEYSSYLTLRTARHEAFQSVAEIDSTQQGYHYLSARFNARVIGSPGACAGLFTYLSGGDDPRKVQEADLEILTRDPRNRVQYTNQPSLDEAGDVVPEATVNSTNPGGRDWSLWNVYRVDWLPDVVSWYVNGESVANISFQTPKDPASLIANMWSNGGSWTGNMSLYDEAFLQIQWIEIAYNASDSTAVAGSKRRDERHAREFLDKREDTPGCANVCGIDEQTGVVGTPTFLYNTAEAAAVAGKEEGIGALILAPLALTKRAVFGY